jgi:Fe-S-cluster-containing dehydrogenase component
MSLVPLRRIGLVQHRTIAEVGNRSVANNARGTCSYAVPQYNPARGVVGKCDLWQNRLLDRMEPACVS